MAKLGKKDNRSKVEKALDTIKVSGRGLMRLPEPQRSWKIRARQVRQRNSIMYRDWLDAEDKDAMVSQLRERWGFRRKGDVLRIIEKGKAGVVPSMAAEVEVLRRVKREEILNDNNSRRAEIDNQLAKARQLRAEGQKFIDVEEVESTGGKNGDERRWKRVGIDGYIRQLEAERAKSYVDEATALADYGTKPGEDRRGPLDGVAATTEFVRALTHYEETMRKPRGEEVEVEVT